MASSSLSPVSAKQVLEEDERWASLCNCVVNFLLEERYLLAAFELLHELLEDGRSHHALRLREFFSDTSAFSPDALARVNSNPVADPQNLLDEKLATEEKLALTEYELRLVQEDVARLKTELQQLNELASNEFNGHHVDDPIPRPEDQSDKRAILLSSLGALKENERKDLNCAVKEYLLSAGYRLTAMTLLEEVHGQNLNVWASSSACVPDALRRYYYQYLSSSTEAAEEKMSFIRENERLQKDNDKLINENESLLKSKESIGAQVSLLTKSLEAAQKDLKDKEKAVQEMKQLLDLQRKELNDCRAEITALKMHIEGTRSSKQWSTENLKPSTVDVSVELKALDDISENSDTNKASVNMHDVNVQKMGEPIQDNNASVPDFLASVANSNNEICGKDMSAGGNLTSNVVNGVPDLQANTTPSKETAESQHLLFEKLGYPNNEKTSDHMGLDAIQILAYALPKIYPHVLINSREELIPLFICAIERHPDVGVRDSLTHDLFNLIKRPSEHQRSVIMDACVSLAKNIGEMRTETELLPQCWEQINHYYEERKLLVAQSCGELAEYVRPEIRDSLILSIIQQLIEDPATVVRAAATHNLALLIPLFPNLDKYYKVEELMFQIVCDPSGMVVDVALKELVPAVIKWGSKLDHLLRILLSHVIGSIQRCPPLSGVEGTVDSHVRVLGENERWNIEIFLRMLTELIPFIYQYVVSTCPFTAADGAPSSTSEHLTDSLLKLYAVGQIEWPSFEWMHTDCLYDLVKIACFLPQKEDNVRKVISKFLLDVSGQFGKHYLEGIMIPVFHMAVGDSESADLALFPKSIHSKIKGLRPKSSISDRLTVMCVLPLFLAGILGSPLCKDQLTEYLRKLLIRNAIREDSWSVNYTAEVINAVRFLGTFEEHRGVIFTVLWEMVVSSDTMMKTNAADLIKVLVPYCDIKDTSSQILPALITLGSDQNLAVKYASIEANGVVAQHFKNDNVIDKIRVQMDAFLDDGSHEATVYVIRALAMAVPHTTDRLREYLLSKIFKLTSTPSQGIDIVQRRERANAFCEAVRALDATDIPTNSVRDLLLPSIQNLMKDSDALDPAHKEALEIIARERSGGTLDSFGKVMGAHLGIASSVTNFFGESGLLGRKDGVVEINDSISPPLASPAQAPPDGGTRFSRMMRGGLGEMIRGKPKNPDDS